MEVGFQKNIKTPEDWFYFAKKFLNLIRAILSSELINEVREEFKGQQEKQSSSAEGQLTFTVRNRDYSAA